MPRSASQLPPLSELQQRYSYCPDSGELRYREHEWRGKVGALAGYALQGKQTSYLRIRHKDSELLVHRICWKMATGNDPEGVIDHINGNGLDNRICNLRDVSNIDNARNRNGPTNAASGVRGVTWHKQGGYWVARINTDTGTKYLGYGDLLHCVALRKSAEQRLGYL